MGQQESTYKKLDEKARRRRREKNDKKEARKEEEQEEQEEKVTATSTTSSSSLLTEKEKVKAGGPFSLASLRWRPSLTTSTPTEADLSVWPGWYHGWCNKAQVSLN